MGYFVVTEEDCPAFRINRHPGNLNICPDFEKTWDDPHSYPTDRDPLVVTLMEEDILSGQMIDLFPLKTRPIPFSGGNSPTPDADGYYPAGRYLVGIDLPAGEYCIQSTNVNTPGNYWFEHSLYEGKFAPTGCGRQCWQMVQDGDILGVENARLIPIQSAPEVKPDENGYYHSGEYRVGIDLPTGIYQLHMEPVGTAVVYENARHNSKGRLDYFHGETITRYLELGEGEILRLEQASVLSAEKAPPAARNADGSYPPGMYLVGYDIPAGAYCISADGGSSYRYDVDHTTRREEYDDEPLFSDRSIEPGHAYFILDEGTYLILRSGALKPADEVCFPIDPNKEQLSGWYRIDTDIPAGKYRFTAEETYYELYLTDKPQGNPFFLDQILLEQSDILTLEKGKYLYAKHVTIEKQ